jgi:hypothetical protein
LLNGSLWTIASSMVVLKLPWGAYSKHIKSLGRTDIPSYIMATSL